MVALPVTALVPQLIPGVFFDIDKGIPMELINCPVCRCQFSEDANQCPHCGNPHTTPFVGRVAIFIAMIVLAGIVGSNWPA